MRVHKVNGVQVADLVNAGLVVKERAVLPLWVSVPFYAARWTVRKIVRLLVVLTRFWAVTVPVLAGLVLFTRFGWTGPVGLVAGLAFTGVVWRQTSPATFDALVVRRGYGAWRGLTQYRRRWWAAMDGTGLSRQTATGVYVPHVTRITSTRPTGARSS